MTTALHRDAQFLLRRELERRRALLARLPADRRAALEHLLSQTVAQTVDAVLDQARSEPRLAAALATIYADPTPTVRTALAD